MKILMIIPSLGSGGAERVLSSLANDWIAKKKCNVEIVCLIESEDFYHIDERIKIHRLNYNPNGGLKFLNLIKLLLKLRNLINIVKPDLCFSFIRQSNIITLLASKGLKTKVVISERDSPKVEVSPLYAYLRKKLYPSCNGMIVQTHEYKSFVENQFGNIKQQVIPNPVRDISINNIKKENIIISVGRLIPSKGHKYLIEAFANCKYKNNWELVILGDGVLKEELMQKAKTLGIEKKVKLIGATKKVDSWLCKSSIFAFTSVSEGFPNALAEAMSASLPCISFDCITGPKELIEDGHNGYLVNVGDIEHFTFRLDQLMQNEPLRKKVGVNAKKTANSLDFNKISELYFLFLVNVMRFDR